MGEQAVSKRWKKRCIKGAQNGAKKVRKTVRKTVRKMANDKANKNGARKGARRARTAKETRPISISCISSIDMVGTPIKPLQRDNTSRSHPPHHLVLL